jgi:predicted restriction endonuclease
MARIFGELEHSPVGSVWVNRKELAAAGVHRPTMNGISGTAAEGADSIVISGGYEDDLDLGEEIIYTGTGGYDTASRKQISDQTFSNTNNAGLVTSQLQGLPVRVIRGAGGDPGFSPTSGYRYDGLYSVVDHWSEIGKSGFRVCRYRLVALTDPAIFHAQPFTKDAVPIGETNPRRISAITTRVVRSTKVSEYVKKIHEYRCQICGIEIMIPNGKLAEGAHIRALGKPHNGPDSIDNVLCLCPNHHSAFDLGGIWVSDDLSVFDFNGIKIGTISTNPKHNLDNQHFAYHRSLWGNE